MCHDKNIKGGSKRIEPHRQIKVSCYQQKKDYFIYDFFCKLHSNHKAKIQSRDTKQKMLGVGGNEQVPMENQELDKVDGKRRKKKHWRYNTTRRQKIK